MRLLSVILGQYSDYMGDRFNKEINHFKKEEIFVKKEVYIQGKNVFIEWNIEESSLKNYTIHDFENIFKYYMANALSDIILYDMEEKLVHKILLNQYYYFIPKEREIILKHLKDLQENEEYYSEEKIHYRMSRKAQILQPLMDYLEQYNEINLEGFIQFRLGEYIQDLEDSVDKAVEEYLMEREYNEFIRLLKYFVDIQEAKIDMVHVLIHEDGKYHLYDKKNRMINNEYLEDLALEMADKDISYEDLLISSMITLAPEKIVIHFCGKVYYKEIIETIKKVFFDRVCVCNGCELCIATKNVKQE